MYKKHIIIAAIVAIVFMIPFFSSGQTNPSVPNKIEVTVKHPEQENKTDILEAIKSWLIPVSTFITLLTLTAGAYESLKEYRLKLQAEQRLAISTAVDMDIKLMKGFTDLLALAHARKGSYLSEKAVEKMFDNKLFTEQELKDPDLINRKLESVAVLNVFSGEAEQSAFVAAITNLALKHEILKAPTIQALETMQNFIPNLAQKYLKIINESPKKTN